MSEADLRAINNIPARVLIKAGSSLLVPRSAHMDKDITEHMADNGQVSLAPEIVLKRSTVRAGKGETVASIARKYKVSTDTVAQWNKVSAGASFKAGQQVVMFLPESRKITVAAQPNTKKRVAAAPIRQPGTKLAKR
jgi:membrane-bound lytic murein transglycosylase D